MCQRQKPRLSRFFSQQSVLKTEMVKKGLDIWDRDRDKYRSWYQLLLTVNTSIPNKYIQNYLTSEVDPFLVSIYSLSFPIAYVNSVLSPEDFQRSRSVFKSTYKFLTISGNLVLLLSLAAVTFLVQTNELKHFPQIRIRRDCVRYLKNVFYFSTICIIYLFIKDF